MQIAKDLSFNSSFTRTENSPKEFDYYVDRDKKKILVNHLEVSKSLGVKRLIDILISALGIVILIVVFPFIALGIKLSSKGPIFFSQERTGLNGRIFKCYKFRTMHQIDVNYGDGKPSVTKKKDIRVFAFGNILRSHNIDELPQLLNVLKGDMSLVGPRPHMIEECAYWRSQIIDYDLRYLVKPGITGLAQVSGYRGGNLDLEHMEERIRRDIKYIESYSSIMDMQIVIKTILQMLHLNTGAH
jgi:putative colanic acid biosysnthesis UDP-glucose lipid carrier transferase